MQRNATYTRRGALGLAAAWGLILAGCGAAPNPTQIPLPSDSDIPTPPTITKGELKVPSSLYFPPLVIDQDDGERTGFGFAVCNEIGDLLDLKVIGIECENRSEVVEMIQAGTEADLGGTTFELGALPDGIIASNAIIACNLSILDHNGASGVKDADDLRNFDGTIMVQNRPVARQWCERELEDGSYELVVDPEKVLQAVREDRADIGIIEQMTALYFTESLYTTLQIIDTVETGWSYGFIARAENEELMTAVNQALSELEEDGSMASLEARWFGSVIS